MIAYHVSGWHLTLDPRLYGKSTTRSDGIIFSSMALATHFAITKMDSYRIERVELDDDDPQIDFYITSGIWTPPNHLLETK